uniref:Uncharacterized protein n=1 Tax=Acrobeloides nanus TaxID=290746 RepID=A0A914D7N8_9BILA
MKDICTAAIVEDQQRSPLITMTDDESNSSKSSQGPQHGDLAAQNSMSDGAKSLVDDKCCCGLIHIRIAAIIIAILELVFIIYQMTSTIWLYDKIDDEYAFAFTLTLFSFMLALVAVGLMVVGV